MGKLNPKQVENLTEPGTYEDGAPTQAMDWYALQSMWLRAKLPQQGLVAPPIQQFNQQVPSARRLAIARLTE